MYLTFENEGEKDIGLNKGNKLNEIMNVSFIVRDKVEATNAKFESTGGKNLIA